MLKKCSRCESEAKVSFVCVFSTLGAKPRRQKCSAAVLFCHGCMRGLLADSGCFGPELLRISVHNAYTHVEQALGPPADRAAPSEPDLRAVQLVDSKPQCQLAMLVYPVSIGTAEELPKQ
jgi:hypothetical protein